MKKRKLTIEEIRRTKREANYKFLHTVEKYFLSQYTENKMDCGFYSTVYLSQADTEILLINTSNFNSISFEILQNDCVTIGFLNCKISAHIKNSLQEIEAIAINCITNNPVNIY